MRLCHARTFWNGDRGSLGAATADAACSFSQPIQMRMQELTEAGLRSDIAVNVYGEDLNILRQKQELQSFCQ